MKPLLALSALALWCTAAPAVFAQTGGGYDLTRNTIAGGGATFSTGPGYILGGTIGQPDAGVLSAGTYSLRGGFWPGVISSGMPAPTSTVVVTPTNTLSVTPPSATMTPTLAQATPPPTLEPTSAVTATQTGAVTPLATDTPTSTVGTPTATLITSPTPTPTATPISSSLCVGDCGHDMTVTVDELLTMIDIALGNALVTTCDAGDPNHDDQVTIDEILAAVNNALSSCPGT